MSNNNLDYNAERYCPVYNEIIGDGLCYDTIMCMTKQIKVSSLPELNNVKDIQRLGMFAKNVHTVICHKYYIRQKRI